MQILGVHFDRPYVRCAAIEIKGKKTAIQCLKSYPPDNVKPLYISDWKGNIATGLDALIRHLDFKISSPKQIELGLSFQIETLTHMNLEELTYAAQIRPSETGAESTIFLVPKEALKNHLLKCEEFSLSPDLVTGIPQALLQYCKFRRPDLDSAFLINLGSNEWTCVWMERGEIKKAFTIQEGIDSLLSALWEDRKKVLLPKEVKGVAKQIDLLQLKSHLNPILSEQLAHLRNKLSSVLFSFQQSGGIKPVFFTGRIDSFGHLCKYLLEEVPELTLYEPPMPLNFEESKCAIAIGLALEGTIKEPKRVQFLKGEFTSKKTWLKAGYWGIGLMLASFAFSGALAYSGNRHFLETRQEMAASLKKVLDKTDKNLAKGIFANGIEEGMSLAFSAIKKYDKEAFYLLPAPSVSEAIGWLSSHPLLEALQIAGDPLEILDLKYHLVSYPRIESQKEPYRAKVELEFRVKSPMSARKFHETLLQGDQLIDSSQEIAWESLSDTYRTSFYLKNRQPYVR